MLPPMRLRLRDEITTRPPVCAINLSQPGGDRNGQGRPLESLPRKLWKLPSRPGRRLIETLEADLKVIHEVPQWNLNHGTT